MSEEARSFAGVAQTGYGHLAPIDTGIVQIIALLASDPAYGEMKFNRIPEMLRLIRSGGYFAAVEDNVCSGVILFARLPLATARLCIAENRMPQLWEVTGAGEAICMGAISGKNVKAMAREFVRRNRGNVILYERHFRAGQPRTKQQLGWIDRAGFIRGVDVGGKEES